MWAAGKELFILLSALLFVTVCYYFKFDVVSGIWNLIVFTYGVTLCYHFSKLM